jgi:hypothetical protein
VGKPEEKSPLERPRRKLVDNIKIDLGEIAWDGVDWINLIEKRDQRTSLAKTVTKLWIPQNTGKFLSSCTTGGLSRRAQFHRVI